MLMLRNSRTNVIDIRRRLRFLFQFVTFQSKTVAINRKSWHSLRIIEYFASRNNEFRENGSIAVKSKSREQLW